LPDGRRRRRGRGAAGARLRGARPRRRRGRADSGPRRRAGARGAGLGPLRPGRRRALREDGAQRDRVRADAGVRRGPEHPPPRVRRPPGEDRVTIAPEQQQNPLLEGLQLRRTPDPCALVIFGASGDLTHKKLFPALYALAFRRLLPERFAVVGVARSEGDDDQFRADMKEAVQKYARDEFREDIWDALAANMRYVATDFAEE